MISRNDISFTQCANSNRFRSVVTMLIVICSTRMAAVDGTLNSFMNNHLNWNGPLSDADMTRNSLTHPKILSKIASLRQDFKKDTVNAAPSRILCPAGQYSSTGSCKLCPAGLYSALPGETDCAQCPAGAYSSTGSISCITCLPGSYSNVSSSSCTLCSVGYYATTGTECKKCESGSYSDFTGSSTCKGCPVGSFSGPGASSCTPCSSA